MAAESDPLSSPQASRVQSSVPAFTSPTVAVQTPKVSKFGAKCGFVIPKNKLSGSLVPIFKSGGKVEGNSTGNEDSTKQTQRKTRWGHDLTQDAAVKKGKALAYQTRLEQINQQLKGGVLDKDNDGLESPKEAAKSGPSTEPAKDVALRRELLELEKREVIGEIMRLNPAYKAPADYKPLQKEGKVPIPIKEHPGHNFIGLFIGPANSTQKRLEEETGAKIRLYGIKKETNEKHDITQQDARLNQDAYQELYVNISADTYEKVDAAIALIELLLKPLLGNAGVSSPSSTSVAGNSSTLVDPSFAAIPIVDVNQGIAHLMSQAPLPGPMQYQPYASSWYSGAPLTNPVALQSSVPNSFPRFPPSQLAPVGMNPYGGQPPFNTAQPHVQAMQHPVSQPHFTSQPIQSGNVSAPRPALPLTSQPLSVSPYSPIRPLTMPVTQPVGSAGWTPVPQVSPPIQRPNISPLAGQMMGPNFTPSTNMPPNVVGRPPQLVTSRPLPPTANFARPPSLHGQQDFHSFSSTHSQTGRPFASTSPMPHMLNPAPRPLLPGPAPNSGPSLLQTPALVTVATNETRIPISSSVLVGAPRPVQPPAALSDRPGVITPGNTQSFFPAHAATTAPSSVPSLAASRPLGPISGDFTFQPLRGSVPTSPNPAGSSGQTILQTAVPLRAPQPPSFRATVQAPPPAPNSNFASPLVANANLSQGPIRPPPSSVLPFPPRPFADPRSANLVSPTQMRPPNYASVPQGLNHPGSLPAQHVQPVNLHQNQLPPAVRPGNFMIRGPQYSNPLGSVAGKVSPNLSGNQIYDPFSPTSFSSASRIHGDDPLKGKKPESDAEYEDLMASVGVK